MTIRSIVSLFADISWCAIVGGDCESLYSVARYFRDWFGSHCMTIVINYHHLQLVQRTFWTRILPSIISSPFQTNHTFSTSAIKMGISNYASTDGEFRRKASSFRNHIQVGGKYPPEKDRYHLCVSWACPWGTFPTSLCFTSLLLLMTFFLACRTLIVRELKGLQEIIPKTVVHYHMGDK